ncbi:MAG: TMEM175 family protein [Peptoniphilaceae bacterium]
MTSDRMEAFSDGVLAIIITIMVLKLKVPESNDLNGIKEVLPILIAYILSYLYVGIYWANHHHLLSTVDLISGGILWKNLHWIFWMSLIPTTTEWVGLSPFEAFPTVLYGIVLFMCAVSYNMLQSSIIKINGKDSLLAKSIGRDLKGKLSILFYAIAIIFSFYNPTISYLLYALIALACIIPDMRLENIVYKK